MYAFEYDSDDMLDIMSEAQAGVEDYAESKKMTDEEFNALFKDIDSAPVERKEEATLPPLEGVVDVVPAEDTSLAPVENNTGLSTQFDASGMEELMKSVGNISTACKTGNAGLDDLLNMAATVQYGSVLKAMNSGDIDAAADLTKNVVNTAKAISSACDKASYSNDSLERLIRNHLLDTRSQSEFWDLCCGLFPRCMTSSLKTGEFTALEHLVDAAYPDCSDLVHELKKQYKAIGGYFV